MEDSVTMKQSEEMYRTKDLSLAAYLSLNGQSYRIEVIPDGSKLIGWWTFSETSQLKGLVDGYSDGLVRVEPRRFQREVAHVRSDVMDAVRAHGQPARDGG